VYSGVAMGRGWGLEPPLCGKCNIIL